MKKTDVIKYYGSALKVAKALKISHQAVYDWPDPIPLGRAYQIQVLTNGKLKAEDDAA